MLPITSLILLVILALCIWGWQANMRAKEIATNMSKRYCRDRHLQFLDGTTVFQKISLRRDEMGRIRLLRRYGFDYYDGVQRRKGFISIFKHRVLECHVSEATTADSPESKFKSANESGDNVIQFPSHHKDKH